MMPQLLPPDARAKNRRRWSFRFSSLTTITVIAVGVWNMLPSAMLPTIPEWGKWAILGVAVGLAIAANASHLFDQPSLNQPAPPPGNDFHQKEDSP